MAENIEGASEVSPLSLASRIEVADSFLTRAKELLGRSLRPGEGLYISPCSAVHTFGMSEPIDVIFLRSDETALAIYSSLAPWRLTRHVQGAHGVLEFHAGTVAEANLRVGQKVIFLRWERERVGEKLQNGTLANLILSAFWLYLAVRMIPMFIEGQASSSAYMLFAVNSLIAVLFLIRRKEKKVTDSLRDRLVTLTCIFLGFSLRPDSNASLLSHEVTVGFMTLTLAFVFFAYLNLGRSFGLIPADRGLKLKGAYSWVRHPLYAAEILFFGSFLLANYTPMNLSILIGIIISLDLRARAEERLLAGNFEYRDYCKRVRARYIPYVV